MKQPMTFHITYSSSSYFYFIHSFNLLCLTPFLLLTESICIFLPILLICPIYTTSLYFIMARGKLPPMLTPNTWESMIEYTLISSILDRICEKTTKPLEYLRNDTQLLPFQHLLEIITWGIEWKRTIHKIDEWATWWWTNAKLNKENLALLKQTINISKEDMENYHWAMFTHGMDYFLKHTSLKKPISKHFFTCLLNNLSTEDLITLGNLTSTWFLKPWKWLCNFRQASLVATWFKEQSFKTTNELSDDKAGPKTTKHVW